MRATVCKRIRRAHLFPPIQVLQRMEVVAQYYRRAKHAMPELERDLDLAQRRRRNYRRAKAARNPDVISARMNSDLIQIRNHCAWSDRKAANERGRARRAASNTTI